MDEELASATGLDTTVPHVARIWDYFVGGKDNFAVDREAAEALIGLTESLGAPTGRQVAQEDRAFISRSVRFLAAEAGIRQFLDIGSGLPTAENTHQVAQRHAPDARVVYVDNDPVVLVHGRALLVENEQTTVVTADLRAPRVILEHPVVRGLIDFDQPVAVMLVSMLHLFPDSENPLGIVETLLDAVPAGSYLVLTHVTGDAHPEAAAALTDAFQRLKISAPMAPRSQNEILPFFTGCTLVEPGLVYTARWRPSPGEDQGEGTAWMYAGVARKL